MFRTAINSFVGTASVVAIGLAVLSSPAWAGKPQPQPASGPIPISACQDITASGSYVLVGNIKYTSTDNGTCLKVTADFVTIDLGGFSVTGPGTTGSIGIGDSGAAPNLRSISVSNGIVSGFEIGVQLQNVDDAVVHNVRAVYNLILGLNLGAGSQVTDNTLSHNDDGNPTTGAGAHINCPSLVSGNVALGNSGGRGFILVSPSPASADRCNLGAERSTTDPVGANTNVGAMMELVTG